MPTMSDEKAILERLERLAAALDRLAPPRAGRSPTSRPREAFVWQASPEAFLPVAHVNRQPLGAAQGHRPRRRAAARQHAPLRPRPARQQRAAVGRARHGQVVARQGGARRGAPASWGSERKGKPDLKLVEIHREDIASLPACLAHLRAAASRFIVFCDDLSFDKDDTSYKSLKAVLEGGIEGRPENVLFYATSNRRHLMPRDMMENERSTAINPSEAVEEKVSLSDRFGLWLGFHNATQDEYLDMVRGYAAHHKLKIKDDELVREALEWSMTRGARSGRVAWQFIQDLAGRLGQRL